MRTLLLSWLLACTGEPADKAAPTGDTAAQTADTGGTEPLAWTAQRACDNIRLFATAGERGLALEVHVDVLAAVIDQAVAEIDADFAPGGARGIVQDGMVEDDVCSSVEEFPPLPGPHWTITGGTLHLAFTPTPGLDADDTDWSYDGTVVGTVRVELRDLVLSPLEGAPPAALPDLDLEAELTVTDLPA